MDKFIEVGVISKYQMLFKVFSSTWAYAVNGYVRIGNEPISLAGARFIFMGCYVTDPTKEVENGNNFDLLIFCTPANHINANGRIFKYSARSGSMYNNGWVEINTTKIDTSSI